MELELNQKNLYFNTFIAECSKASIDLQHDRILSAIRLNDEFAEYFKDRAQIEDTYAKSIAKLSKKPYITNRLALGTFSPLWEILQAELTKLSTVHSEYASSIISEIEQPLRTSIQNNESYYFIHEMEGHLQKLAKEVGDIDHKLHKHKKSSKGEAKTVEFTKQQEQRLTEWKKDAPRYLQNCLEVDEYRLNNLKSTIHQFENLQKAHSEKIIEVTGNSMAAAAALCVEDEINAFCSAHASTEAPHLQNSIIELEAESIPNLLNADNVVPQPSLSNVSLKQPPPSNVTPSQSVSTKREKKKFFQAFTSIRRKPKSDAHQKQNDHNLQVEYPGNNRQRSISNPDSYVETSSIHSTNEHNEDHNGLDDLTEKPESPSVIVDQPISDLVQFPNSPTSVKSPSLNNSLSPNVSSTNLQTSPPLIQIDSEGYSIPPANRSAWPLDDHTMNDPFDNDDFNSDAGSLIGNSKIRVDIKSEAVTEEDASQSAVALTRVATLLKEKNPSSSPTSRRGRGRREIRSTQLFPVTENGQTSNNETFSQTPILEEAHDANNIFSDASELNQEYSDYSKNNEVINLGLPTIDVHISETVNLISRAGSVEKFVALGEISVSYQGPRESASFICIKLDNNRKNLEISETTEFASQLLDGYSAEDYIFKLNTQSFANQSLLNPTSSQHICIKYQTDIDEEHAPIIVKPLWKCDSEKSRLLVKYHKHKDIPVLENVLLATSVTGNVQNALSIPAGELILSQSRIKWDIGQLDDNHDENEPIIKAQFNTLEQGTPQPIVVRFEVKDRLLTNVGLQQTNTDPLLLWPRVNRITKTLKTGKYIAYM